MAHYLDGYVLAVPRKNKAAYTRMARKCARIWREHGALEVRECWADDVKPGKSTSFPQAVKLKSGEAVVFSYIVYPSRAVRDRCNKKVMQDPRRIHRGRRRRRSREPWASQPSTMVRTDPST